MLKLVNIIKDYKMADSVVHAVRGVNLNFRKSEFVSILGPSGCGKTTLLNIIGGLDQYTDGDLIINDRSTKEFRSRDWDAYRNRSIGFIFQSYNLIPHLNVLQNVELALTISGVSRKKKRKLAVDALERVGLGAQLKKKPNQMSGGQMQRVAIARAIVNNPEIILADEPTGALDTKTSEQVMDLLQEIADDRLVIMVTHNPELAQRYSTRIIELMDGEVQHDSNPYDGMPTILSPVTAMSDDGVTPIEEYIAKSEEEEVAVSAPEQEQKKDKKDKKEKAKKEKPKKKSKSDLVADSTEHQESSALSLDGASVSEPAGEEKASLADATADASAPAGDNTAADEKFVAVVSPEVPVLTRKRSGKPKREKKERTSMSFLTALSLSARNLVAKRTRTFLTAFAGSIGIIGIALVLSLSNGFDLYMNDLEGSILNSMPLTVNTVGLDVDVESLMNMEFQQGEGEQYPDKDDYPYIKPYKPSGVMGLEGIDFGLNVLTDEYMEYVQNIPDELPGTLNAIRYSYAIEMPLLLKTGSGNTNSDYTLIEPTGSNVISDAMSSMGMGSNPIGWQQLLWDDFMLSQFDVLAGGYPGTDTANAVLGESYEGGETYDGNKARSAVLVINSYNMIDYSILEALGMDLEQDAEGNYLPIDFEKILGTEITVVGNNNYYTVPEIAYADSETGFVSESEVYDENGSFKSEYRASVNENFAGYDPEENVTVKIVGVMRVKSEILTPLLQTGVAYTEDLVQLCLDNAKESEIVKYQSAFSGANVVTGKKFTFDFSQITSLIETFGLTEASLIETLLDSLFDGSLIKAICSQDENGNYYIVIDVGLPKPLELTYDEIMGILNGIDEELKEALYACKTINQLLETIQSIDIVGQHLSDANIRKMLKEMDDIAIPGTSIALSGASILALIDSSYDTVMQALGGNDTPTGAYIYPTTFEAKDQICAYLDAWNEENPGMSVKYTDSAGMISSLLTQVVDIVSYILIAFAAISLVVSSVMIAIITYVSVLERTTEIGVLRSIGARKLDISNLFNAETAIIGASAGILGVFLAWIIDFPINAWIASLATQAPPNFAVLNPLHALLLVALSIGLTVLSGLVPAIAAARKDPVKALRSAG